ncbi:MAG: PfkB family carbohydrate kinase, partial [Actinomycetota bacterium]|nr:PfkB family carbohydrate kinase [Actinomycetota bacterium]
VAVMTEGDSGGSYWTADGRRARYDAAAPPGPVVDRYGAGDSFAAGLTYALARGDGIRAALALAARCGAAVVAGRGPYEGQLTASEV